MSSSIKGPAIMLAQFLTTNRTTIRRTLPVG